MSVRMYGDWMNMDAVDPVPWCALPNPKEFARATGVINCNLNIIEVRQYCFDDLYATLSPVTTKTGIAKLP
jgi:hypothetical protein